MTESKSEDIVTPTAPASKPKKSARKKPASKRKKRWPWVLLAVIIAAATAYMLFPKAPAAPVVNTVEAKNGTLLKTVSGIGTAKAEVSANLSFRQSGVLDELDVKVGDTVRSGQVLARLDTEQQRRDIEIAEDAVRSSETEVTRARAEVDRAQAALRAAQVEVERARNAQAEARRANTKSVVAAQNALASAEAAQKIAQDKLNAQQRLYAAGAISRSDLTAAEIERDDALRRVKSAQADLAYATTPVSNASVEAAQAGVSQAQSGVTQAQANLRQARSNLEAARDKVNNLRDILAEAELVAQRSGVVSSIKFEEGAQVAAGSPVIELTDPSRIYLEVKFDETRSPELAVGQNVAVTFDALPNKTLEGQVERIDPVAQTSGQVASVRTRISLPDAEAVRPGYTGTAVVTVRKIEDTVLIPLETTNEENNVTTVWTVNKGAAADAQATAHKTTISVIERNANDAAVTGLEVGTPVITPYPVNLEENQVVTIKSDSQPDKANE